MPWTIRIVIKPTLRLTLREGATLTAVAVAVALGIMVMVVAVLWAVTEHHTVITTKIMKEATRWMALIARPILSTRMNIMKMAIN